MNGAIAEPDVKKISTLNKSKKMMMGRSHHFFLVFRKAHSSRSTDNLPTGLLLELPLILFPVGYALMPLPIGRGPLVYLLVQQILACQAQHQTEGRHDH